MQTLPSSLKIGVIRGGLSSEYETSLLSGAHVLELVSETHRPIDIFISKDGTWHMQGIEKTPSKILKNVDVVWNGLHGEFGEDGKVQEILSLHGVKQTGTEKYPSSIAMNRWLAKEHLKSIGIKTPTYALVRQTDNLKEKSKEIFLTIPNPLIIKPVRKNSSFETKIAKNYLELYDALYNILSEESDALVEEYINGKVATVGVVDRFRDHKTYSLPAVEVSRENRDEQVCPGNFSAKEKKDLELLASLVHEHLGLKHYSSSDFIVSPKRGIYFINVNTLPELHKNSAFVTSLKSVGASVKDFVGHVLGLAIGQNR